MTQQLKFICGSVETIVEKGENVGFYDFLLFHTITFKCLLLDNGYVGKQPVAWNAEYCAEYWLKGLTKSMDRCTGRRDITEILLKAALNTTQSINQSIKGLLLFGL